MKKFTFLLTLLAMVFCNVQSAFADDAKWTNKGIATFGEAITSLDNLSDGYYVLRNVGRKTFVKAEGEALKLRPAVRSTNFADFKSFFQYNTDVAYVFYLKKSTTENGKYSIQGKTGKYFPNSNRQDESLSLNATEYEYTINHINGSSFGLKGDNFYLDGKAYDGDYMDGTVVTWNAASQLPGATSNGAYQFYPVTLETAYTVNYKYTVNDHVVLAAQKKVVANTAPSADNYPCLTIEGYNKKTITENEDVTVNCSMKLPFELSTAEAPKYYAIKMYTGNRMMVADATNSEVACNEVSTSLPEGLPELNQWAFIGTDAFTSFKLYNKATKKYLKSSSASTIATLVDEAEASTFHVMATRIQNMTNGFCISNSSYYLNYQNPENSNKPGVYGWTDNDQGSTCTVFTPASFPLNYANNWVNIPEGAIGGKAYLETAGNLTALKAAYKAVSSNPTESNINALVTINKAIEASGTSTKTFKEGYYRLVNRKDGNFLHINNTIMNTQAGKDKAVGSVVYFKSTGKEGKYSLMLEGKYLGTVTKSQDIVLGDEASKGTYTVALSTENFITKIQEVSTTNEANYHYLHVNGNNAVGWEAGEGSPASHWYVIPATDIEVDMKTVEGKSYATAYLPFGVSAVTDAKAYVAAEPANGETVMTETASFGAKTGVLLVSETGAEKAVLTIGDVASVKSALSGTLLAKDIADSRTSYLVFGKNKDNATEVGFFEPSTSVTSIPANRAFFEGVASAAIALNFGGNVTAIDQVVNNANVNAPIFDLAGRRVVKAAKGGVYIQNGKKFIVK